MSEIISSVQTVTKTHNMNINFDHLAPTLSAIMAGIIHHLCREKRVLTFVDILIIISPSLPILCGQFLKLFSFMLNCLGNGANNINISFLNNLFKNINFKTKQINNIYENCGFDENNRIIFPIYTVKIDICKKMLQWQQQKLCTKYLCITLDSKIIKDILTYHIVTYFTRHSFFTGLNKSIDFVNFYHEFDINDDKIYLYMENIDTNTYKIYTASTNMKYLIVSDLYNYLVPTKYIENKTKYRISRIYNEYSDELFNTIVKFKESLANQNRKVCTNFCFAGPPGTSKTYAARAIAKEMNREIVEINLSTILYENDFFEIFQKNDISKSVFLFDEIDLMCPSRDFDDKLINSQNENKLIKLDITKEYDEISDDSTNENGFLDKKIYDKIMKLDEKIEQIFSFQNWLKSFLEKIASMIYYGFIFILTFQGQLSNNILSGIHKEIGLVSSLNSPSINGMQAYNHLTSLFKSNMNLNMLNSSSSISTENNLTPFTLRTLLNYISGGNTPDELIIIATTNRPEKLDPALIRPGRLRLMEFKNLRSIDVVNMLQETYPNKKEDIETKLNDIKYKDYDMSGALLEAIMSSCNNLEQIFNIIQREIS